MNNKSFNRFFLSIMLAVLFTAVQIFNGAIPKVMAADNFSVEVVVEGFNGVIATGNSSKSNALEALKDTLSAKNIKLTVPDSQYGGKYISAIGDIKEKHFGRNDGWMYAVYSNGSYAMPFTSVDATELKNGDRFIVYYGSYDATLLPNKVELSTNVPDSVLTISLSNSYNDYTTKKEVVTPLKITTAVIDGTTVQVSGGKITLPKGLSEGNHDLYLSDFKDNAVPNVVSGKIIINMKKPAAASGSQADNSANSNKNIAKDIEEAMEETAGFIKKLPANSWSAVSLNKLGVKPSEDFIAESASEVKQNGVKDLSNTDIEKLIIGLKACGYSSYNFMGYDLPKELYNRNINDFMINDAVFGIIAYKYAGISGNYVITQEALKNVILSKKVTVALGDTNLIGWSYMGKSVDPDLTGIAINALSGFYDKDAAVKQAVDNAVLSLSKLQNNGGYIPSSYGISSESLSFVILGLSSVGVDPENSKFTKEKGDIVQALLSFKGSNGAFKHVVDGKDDMMSTEQALRALITLKEYKAKGKYDYYGCSASQGELKIYAATSDKGLLPRTGSPFDTTSLIILGAAVSLCGVILAGKKSMRQ